jgi:PAS domain S-box-containing protein
MAEINKKDRSAQEIEALRRRVAELESALDELIDEVTQQRQTAEQAAIFRKFAETSGQGFGMGQLDGRITWSNAALARILGHEKPEDVVGTFIPSYYRDEDREILQNTVLPKVIEQGMNTVEMPLVSIDGRVTPCSQAIFLIRDKDDDPLFFANVLTDISERKKAEEALQRAYDELDKRVEERTAELQQEVAERERTEKALRESEENLLITLNSIGDAVIATDAGGNVTRMNPVAETLTGWSAAEAQGRSLDEVFHVVSTQAKETTEHPIENVLQEGARNGLARDAILIARDRTERRIANRGAPIRDKDGDVIGFVFVFRDVTEEQALLEQLRQSQKMEAIGLLAGGVAHDFNNLLTAILGNAQLLTEDLDPDRKESAYAKDIVKASTRAAELTEQLLAFSRKGQMETADVDLHQIIGELVVLLGRSIDKRIDIVTDLQASPSTVHGDLSQLENAFLNLGVNARDAMPDGGELIFSTRNVAVDDEYCRLHTLQIQAGDYVEINVTDTGMGIEPEFQRRVFEPFFTTKETRRGTGLGLPSVYGCVKGHNGAIKIYSEPGEGSTFRVLLPVTESDAPKAPATPREELVRGEGHVLVVDDEETARRFIANALRDLGYTVSQCADGAEGIEFFRQHHGDIDLVILDIVMPKLSGEHVFQLMRDIDTSVHVLMASGFSKSSTINRLLDQGALGFLKKPFRIEDVSQEVARHIKTTPK